MFSQKYDQGNVAKGQTSARPTFLQPEFACALFNAFTSGSILLLLFLY